MQSKNLKVEEKLYVGEEPKWKNVAWKVVSNC